MSEAKDHYALTFAVQGEDIDELGHVNNTVYLRYAEEIARAHSAARGLDLAAYIDLGVLPMVRKHAIHYHQSAVLGDTLEVVTEVAQFKAARAGRNTRVFRKQDGVLLAAIQTEWVWVSPQTNRPTRVLPEILAAFGLAAEK